MRERIKADIVEKLLPKYVARLQDDSAWAWEVVKDAAQAGGERGRDEIVHALSHTDVIKDQLRVLAEAEADTLLTDDSLNLNELNRVYLDG